MKLCSSDKIIAPDHQQLYQRVTIVAQLPAKASDPRQFLENVSVTAPIKRYFCLWKPLQLVQFMFIKGLLEVYFALSFRN